MATRSHVQSMKDTDMIQGNPAMIQRNRALDDLEETIDDAEEIDESSEIDDIPDPEPQQRIDNTAEANLILDIELDPEEIARKENELSLPTGEYVWNNGSCKVFINFNMKDIQPWDTGQQLLREGKTNKNLGRCMWNISGILRQFTSTRTQRFQITVSPDSRVTPNGDEDFFSKNYARFTALYFKKHEMKPPSNRHLVEFIEAGLYKLYITRSKDGRNYFNELRDLST